MKDSLFRSVLGSLVGPDEANYLFDLLAINHELIKPELTDQGQLSEAPALNRAQIAQLLNMILFSELLKRVPESRCYAEEQLASGRRIIFDHGALRTVAMHMKSLPEGQLAFARIFEPLGYRMSGTYPLEKLKMCGFVYTHLDYPEDIAQYFVSELYPDQFSSAFEKEVWNLVYESKDPLDHQAKALLDTLRKGRGLDEFQSISLLKQLPKCFDRQHEIPSLTQYQCFAEESAEMAWISTEGNAFNHATDRVNDLDTVAELERQKGVPMKPSIEEGVNANIRQTAYRATVVERMFYDGDQTVAREVPGSFFEFIQRGQVTDPHTGASHLDLRFDSRNAQGIFTMTRK